jgi:hypothetical protein
VAVLVFDLTLFSGFLYIPHRRYTSKGSSDRVVEGHIDELSSIQAKRPNGGIDISLLSQTNPLHIQVAFGFERATINPLRY